MPGDIIDQASDLELAQTESHLNLARRAAKPEQVQRTDGSWPQPDCEDCGEEIPLKRLLACGSIRCIYCQELLEKRKGGR